MRALPTRWSAAVAHLVLSGLVIGTIAIAAFVNWFPAGLHHAAKLDRLLGIMLVVDIVAGPLLTLIAYRRGKPGLRFDLAVICLLQILFLAYGLSTLWRSRPLFLVGSSQAFALVFANEVPDDAEAKAKGHRWPRFRGSGPGWLAWIFPARLPATSSCLLTWPGTPDRFGQHPCSYRSRQLASQ